MDLHPYKTFPVWDKHSLPEAFTRAHCTQERTWAQLTIIKGRVAFEFLDDAHEAEARHVLDVQNQLPPLPPQRWHRIAEVSDDVQLQLQFLCMPEDYFNKKHGLTRTHSEVVEAVDLYGLEPVRGFDRGSGHVWDAGCGSGRNTLYLARQGFTVDAWDINQPRLDNLNVIAQKEDLAERVHTRRVDFDALPPDVHAKEQYDLVLSTVVLMFLQPQSALNLITHMQQATRPGGHNLVVAAMDAQDKPCPPGLFPFTLAAGQLREAYAGWELRKYNEDVGHLHRTDEQGKPIALRFATMLARKPAT